MRRVETLFLPQEGLDPIWREEIERSVGPRHNLSIFDGNEKIETQFRGKEAVLDTGGSVGNRAMYDAAVDAKLWQIIGTGIDHIDIDYMKTKGFAISNCPGEFSSVALAEYAMMFIIMLSRRYHESQTNFHAGNLYSPTSSELVGKILAIVGFGASGQELARRARAFGMRIRAIDVRPIESAIVDELRPEYLGNPSDLDGLAAECDFISLHLHLTPETRHTIDARRIALMKPSACIINVARGALVDEEAMYLALLDGRLGGAGLDVFAHEPPDSAHPVYSLPNVVVTPHVSGATDGTARRRASAATSNLDRIARGLEPLYRVDR